MKKNLLIRGLAGAVAAAAAAIVPVAPASAAPASALAAATYQVAVTTSGRDRAGTDGDVWLTLNGAYGSSTPIYLDDGSRDDFERGNTDEFTIQWADLGPIASIDIYFSDSGDSWAFDFVNVTYAGKTVLFPYYYWAVEDGTTHLNAV